MTTIPNRWFLLFPLALPLLGCQPAAACDVQVDEGAPTSAPVPAWVQADAPPPDAASTQDDADAWAAQYRFVGGTAERDALAGAIDDVVSEMNILAREIARGRLSDSNPIPKKITIGRNGEVLAIAFDDRSYEAPLDGSKTRVQGITGDMLRYHVVVAEKRLDQVFDGDQGGRHNTMRRRGDTGMAMQVKVTSERLPKALEYKLTFRRD